jgi:4-hydroxybenzoate polyprenyltransferase
LVARHENQRPEPFSLPVVPAMIAGISLVDGLLLAALYGVPWLLAGITGAGLTWVGQRFVRGD